MVIFLTLRTWFACAILVRFRNLFNPGPLQLISLEGSFTMANHASHSCARMGRRSRANSGVQVPHEDHLSNVPSRHLDHRMAMRMVLQAMVAATGTTAALPQRRSSGVGQTGGQEVVEMGHHSENDTTRGVDSSSAGCSRDSIGHGGEHSRIARNIQRDWWDFPSPSGRRSRWLASSSSQREPRREGNSMLEVMAAAASPVLRARAPPTRGDTTTARGEEGH